MPTGKPLLDVRSDSWLDLSASARASEIIFRSQQKQHQKQEQISLQNIPSSRDTSDEIRDRRASTVDSGYRPFCTKLQSNSFQRHSISESSPRLQEHLLIRLRQQTYLNRSSNISTNTSLSNFSNSIELDEELQRALSVSSSCQSVASIGQQNSGRSSEHEDKLHRASDKRYRPFDLQSSCSILNSNQPAGKRVQQVAEPVNKHGRRESARLRSIRERLVAGGRVPARPHLEPNQEAKQNQERPQVCSSPLARSWSSISARVSNKFHLLSHSCKQLLFQHQLAKRPSPEVASSRHEPTSGAPNPNWPKQVDRQALTSDWIQQHHGEQGAEIRAQSGLALIAPVSTNQTPSSRPKSLQIASTDTSTRELHFRNQNARLTCNDSQRHVRSANFCLAPDLVCLSSSKNSNSSSQHQCLTTSLGQDSSSSITLVSDNKQASNPRVVVEQPTDVDEAICCTPVSSSPNSPLDISSQRDLLEAQQQTSDYFSSATRSSERRSGHKSEMMANQQVPSLLLNDPEYYLEVAQAANMLNVGVSHQNSHLFHGHSVQIPNVSLLQRALRTPEDDDADYAVPSDESTRLERSQVELVQMIGEGQKGFVFLGKLQSRDGSHIIDVAIKTLKYETEELIEKLMREASMMRQFEHPHIIKFIGVCPETPALIAMELAQLGEIKDYLSMNKHLTSISQLVLYTFQICTALSYLESKQFVHRDVAARNVLVCSPNCVKLADFGLARNLQLSQTCLGKQGQDNYDQLDHWDQVGSFGDDGKNLYVAAPKGKLPLRWLAPESLVFRRFTSASDVWMFAVCSWEFFHYGQQRPWAQIRNNQILAAIEAGQRLSKPVDCPSRLYQLMLQCWSYAPVTRPKFRDLKQNLWSIYLNERAREHYVMEEQQQMHYQMALLMPQSNVRSSMTGWPPMVNRQEHFASKQVCPTEKKSPDQRVRLTSASPMMINQDPTVTLSGYSSAATATVDHSNDSSRSSSIGSLARRCKNQQGGLFLETSHRSSRESMGECSRDLKQNPASKSKTTKLSEHLNALDRVLQIEASQRRFQRSPGNLLQKQRSQGSIVTSRTSTQELLADRDALVTVDDALIPKRLVNRNRAPGKSYRAFNDRFVRNKSQDYDEDGDEEDGADSSESELKVPVEQTSTNSKQVKVFPVAYRNSNYDGQWNQQISMLRSKQTRQVSDGLLKVGSVQQKSKKLPSLPTGREQRLAGVLASLRVSPLRAKLSINQVSPVPEPVRTMQDKTVLATPSLTEQKAQQLALHQRLLGHIRPTSIHSKRKLGQLEKGQQSSSHVQKYLDRESPSVDQSLQLLESLIIDERPVGLDEQ